MYHPGTWYVPSLVFQYLVRTGTSMILRMYTTVVRRFARASVGAHALLAFQVQYLVVYRPPWYTFCKTEVRQSSSAEAAACCCGFGMRCRPAGLRI